MSNIKQKVVVGLGKTGLSCARFLLRQGDAVAVTDSRSAPPGLDTLLAEYPSVSVRVGGFDATLMQNAEELIVSPGVSLAEPSVRLAVRAGVPAIGDIELFCRHMRDESATFIAITGSNAKSSVTTLVGDMIREGGHTVIVAGNIGLPVMDILLDGKQAEFYVLELSSFQLETTHSLNAKVATILNVSPDHLDRYNGMHEYIAAKQRIYIGCKTAVANADDGVTYPNESIGHELALATFSQSPIAESALPKSQYYFVDENKTICHNDNSVIRIDELLLPGGHNVQNALAALTIGHLVGLKDESMVRALKEFSGLAHRCQLISSDDGVNWINDSKGTNTGATVAAIEGLGPDYERGIVLIAGGVGKDADFSELASSVSRYVRAVVLIGEDAGNIATALRGVCDIHFAGSLREAVKKCRQIASSGCAVLLSPACASFDMFSNFEDRGDQFIAEVMSLPESAKHKGGANAY